MARTPVASATPQRLAITVFAESAALDTFAERVRSWFDDGTTVSVEYAAGSPGVLPAAAAGVVTIWVMVPTRDKALVTFSMAAGNSGERHSVREVRLRDALDELGLERLASVIQSTVAAMREGLEGSDLETLRAELRSAGVLRGAPGGGETGDSAESAPTAPVEAAPAEAAQAPMSGDRLEREPVPHSTEPEPYPREAGLHFDLVYGARYGGDRVVHGPGLGVGWPVGFGASTLWFVLRAGFFLPTNVAAPPFRLSRTTSSVRAGIAFERRYGVRASAYAALLGGADVARIDSRLEDDSSDDTRRYAAGPSVTKVWGQLGLVAGIWYRAALDVGMFGAVDYCTTDVRYVMESANGDHSVLAPWRLQPALFVSGRFDVTPGD